MSVTNVKVKQEFIDSINRVNGTALTASDLVLDGVANASGSGINASVVGTAVEGTDSNVKGSKTFLYNRINLNSMVGKLCQTLTARPVTYVAELLEDINKATKLNLTLDDIINDKLDLLGEEGETFTLRCQPSSPKYTGSLPITMHLSGTVLLRGRMSLVKGKNYSIYPNSQTAMVSNAPFTTFTINGVDHTFNPDGTFTANVETGEWDFYYSTSYLSVFGRNAPITHIDRLMCVDGSLSSGGPVFTYNNSLLSIGDDIFRGNVGSVSLYQMFLQCRSLKTIGTDFMAAPDGYNSLDSTFSGCNVLESMGDTIVRASTQPYTTATSLFNGCVLLERIPAGLFSGASNLTTLNNAFSQMGARTTDGCWVGESLFDDVVGLKAMASCFASAKISNWPTKLFKNHPNLENLTMAFRSSNIRTIPDGMLDKCSKGTLIIGSAFSNCTLTSVGSRILPQGSKCPASSSFSNSRLSNVSKDVFAGALVTDAYSMFAGSTFTDKVPNVFANQSAITSIARLFASANVALTDDNANMFADLIGATTMANLFNGATLTNSIIPKGMFDPLVNVTDCTQAFYLLKSSIDTPIVIHDGLLAKMANAADFTLLFSGAVNLDFKGYVLPDSKSAKILTGAFQVIADNYPDSLLKNAENVVAANNLFVGAKINAIDGALIGTLKSVTDLTGAFRVAGNLTIKKGAFDNLPNVANISNLANVGVTSSNSVVIEEGAFDGAVGLTNAYRAFGFMAGVDLPKGLFKNCKLLTNLGSIFERSTLTGTLDGFLSKETMSNPLTSTANAFNVAVITNLSKSGVLNLPLVGTALMTFANSKNGFPITVAQFLAWVGVSATNHFTTDKVQTGFILNATWIEGETDDLVRGLWQISDASLIDDTTRRAVLGRL
ncbi:hypothetical protein pEaSNUABM54_00038 [Erwinia phage pEa_SNUABM_54]|nr:hypothetical protein pEaSNUABM54_00038 [Erwinia phage pEa_SNUABM_54]